MKRRIYEPIDKRAYTVKRSSAGLGLFALQTIPKGACIIEYVGRVLSKQEEYTVVSQYLFEVNARLTIDGKGRSNTARYINHSCRGNAEPIIYKNRVYIFAKRTIKPGEEMAYDYGKEFWKEYIKPKGCKCEKCK
jgi:SET domain-containing protein